MSLSPAGAAAHHRLLDINAARAAEGVVPMVLPADFGALSAPQQLLALANLERADRGISTPVLGLTSGLDANAEQGAAANADPSPNPFYGTFATSNWAGGLGSTLEVDFGWMYDDGPGSPNADCPAPGAAGCWGHRHDILSDGSDPGGGLTAPLVMGAATASGGQWGTSMAELFVGGDSQTSSGQPDEPLSPTWSQIVATLAPGVSSGRLSLAPSDSSGQLTVWASGETMTVTAAVAPAGGWSVSPATCTLAAGTGCTLTVTAAADAPASARLTLQGPGAAQTVTLSRPAAPTTPPASARPGCAVPRLRGRTLAQAGRLLHSAHCALGRVSGARPGPSRHVVAQSPRPGARRAAGARVSVRLG